MSPNYFQARSGYEPYAVHSLTGAPYSIYDILNINQREELTKRDFEQMDITWKKMTQRLQKGYMISVTSRLPNQRECLKIGDAVNKLAIWTTQRYLTSEHFSRGSEISTAHDFSEIEGIQDIEKMFQGIGLELFERIECEG